MNKKPKHVAIIMDGNGRWAKKQGKNRFLGHQKGAKVVKNIVEEATKNEINFLTLFAFSQHSLLRVFFSCSFFQLKNIRF